jgi:hypothetical protein
MLAGLFLLFFLLCGKHASRARRNWPIGRLLNPCGTAQNSGSKVGSQSIEQHQTGIERDGAAHEVH